MKSPRIHTCAVFVLGLLACDAKPADNLDSSSTSAASGTGESSGTTEGDGFAEACDLGPGWLADDALRQSCSAWLVAYCASRPAGDCSTSFTTTDNHELTCFEGTVTMMEDAQCASSEAQCLAGIESELYLCNACNEEVNVQARTVSATSWEVVRVEAGRCGTSVFVDGYTQCPDAAPEACACGCM